MNEENERERRLEEVERVNLEVGWISKDEVRTAMKRMKSVLQIKGSGYERRQAKAIGLEGDSRVGPSPPSEWPAPPHSLHQPPSQGKAGQLHLLAVCCKACAGHFIGWLFAARPVPATSSAGCLLQGLCRPLRLPAVFATAALSCHALPAHLCHDPCLLPTFILPRSVLHSSPPPLSLPCAPGSSRKFAGTALMAAATRDCTGGPCTVFLGSLRSFKRGRPWTALEQPGSLLVTFVSSRRVHRSWAMV